MATMTILPDWSAIEARALALFVEHRNLEFDDSVLAALVEERAPELAARALRLVDDDGATPFALAFRVVRKTDRYFDGDEEEVLPFEERLAA